MRYGKLGHLKLMASKMAEQEKTNVGAEIVLWTMRLGVKEGG